MATKSFGLSWVGVYRASSNSYYGASSPIMVGGSYEYNSYIGINSSVKDAIASSKVPATMKLRFYVTNGAEFDVGGHRETYNKAYGTMPWYRYLGLHPIFGTGWQEIDLTSAFMDDYLSGNYTGIVLYGGSAYGEAHGITGGSLSAEIVIEGEWNTAPSNPPSITNPRSSTVADQSVNVTWDPSTDAESTQAELSYEVAYYNGSGWSGVSSTGAGETSYNYLLSGVPETSRAQFRVRAVDPQGLKSSWTYSPYFTVSHNIPPAEPTNLNPSGGQRVDRTQLIRATWRHNDDGAQAGYRIGWRTVASDGTKGVWNYIPSDTGWVNSTEQHHDFTQDLFPLSEIEWYVMTKDQQGEESPQSSYERFYAGEPSQAPIWLNPTSGSTVNSSDIVADWSSIDQVEYQIELLQGTTLLWSKQEITSAKSVAVGYALQNNITYTLRLRIVNVDSQLWSNWSEINFTTQFIPPAKPLLTIDTLDNNGESLSNPIVMWDTDNPVTETPTTHVQVFRREYDEQATKPWLIVGNTLPPDSTMIDYSPAGSQWYEYMVRAWNDDNDTYTDSDIVEIKLELDRTFIQREQSLSDMLVVDASERESGYDLRGELMFFSGRQKPVFEHNLQEENTMSLSWFIETPEELRSVLRFVKRRETFLYRDNNGRRFFCVLRSPQVTDRPAGGFNFSLDVVEVDYKENFMGG